MRTLHIASAFFFSPHGLFPPARTNADTNTHSAPSEHSLINSCRRHSSNFDSQVVSAPSAVVYGDANGRHKTTIESVSLLHRDNHSGNHFLACIDARTLSLLQPHCDVYLLALKGVRGGTPNAGLKQTQTFKAVTLQLQRWVSGGVTTVRCASFEANA
jgi:hypothetical protein